MEVTILFLTFISISSLSSTANIYGGLFGYTGSQSEISHIGLTNVQCDCHILVILLRVPPLLWWRARGGLMHGKPSATAMQQER